ncbi:FUSC family protein [Arsenicicoccus sp. oral taxon 190]|uniref:FUSC family protein n=1 Tax=Arsenicicoccus sp. oral taxon 190 TaxID=1658671 RepID=UPI000AFD187A|nr:FUSC family protein [Arsenicicoccus sp. oral taxon 190]
MSSDALRRHARSVLALNPSAPRRVVAVKAALAMGLPLAAAQLAGRLSLGLLASLGVLTILYGPATPGRFRARLMAVVGAGLVASVSLGALVAGRPVLTVVALVAVAVLATFACVTLKVGPPGAYFFALTLGVANVAVAHGTSAGTAILATCAGALVAWCVGMSDLLVGPHRPEARAVAAADRAVAIYESAPQDEVEPSRAAASRALHAGWTAVSDGGSHPPQVAALAQVQERYAAATARLAHHRLGAVAEATGTLPDDPGASGAEPQPWGSVDDDAAQDDIDRPTRVDPFLDAEQLRDSSLGRPRAGYVLRAAVRRPSEVLLISTRVLVATALAGTVAVVSGRGHAYWTVAFAMLVLHQGGTRETQTVRGIHRTIGTLGGLLVFALLVMLHVQGWWVVLVVVALQLVVELLVTRNYALAVVAITPLALTIGTASAPGAPVDTTVADRLVDTLVGVASALAVLWLTGRSRAELQLRGHARRVVVAIERVLEDLAADALTTRTALDHRRHLYYELLECDAVARRAAADAPRAVAPYRRMERSVSALGYLVLGACWHPDLRRSHAAFDLAREPLARIMAEPVTRPRPAETIERDVRAVEGLIATLRRDG